MKFFINLSLLIYSHMLIFFLIIISPIIRIKIGNIETRTIGNGSISYEIYFYEKKLKQKKNEINIWFHEKKIANKFLLSKFREKFLIFPGILLFKPFQLINRYNLKFLMVDIRIWISGEKLFNISEKKQLCPCKDVNDILNKFDPLIQFTPKETEKGFNSLKNLGVNQNDRFVCFTNRTPDFKGENYNSTRNYQFETLIESANYLSKKNYKIIFMGDSQKNIENYNDKNFIFYSNSKYKNSFMDLFIIYRCKFFVQSPSGIGQIATMMRKPRLITNYFCLEQAYTESDNLPIIILPKKILQKKNMKYLSYEEFLKKRICLFRHEHQLFNNGYILENNTSKEILEAIIEMEEKIRDNSFEKNNNDQIFWEKYNKIFNGFGPKKMRISNNFYNSNISLFEA